MIDLAAELCYSLSFCNRNDIRLGNKMNRNLMIDWVEESQGGSDCQLTRRVCVEWNRWQFVWAGLVAQNGQTSFPLVPTSYISTGRLNDVSAHGNEIISLLHHHCYTWLFVFAVRNFLLSLRAFQRPLLQRDRDPTE